MSKKYYAVRQGKKIGVFDNWDEVKTYVNGFKGAEYKSFKTYEEAESFVKGEELSVFDFDNLDKDLVIAYVDGSYNINTKVFGYGIVLIHKDGEMKLNGAIDNEAYADQRNVAGEIYGAREAINKAIDMGMSKIIIHFDYKGIKAWALGEWKANLDLTQNYQKFINEKKELIDIEFVKVKAHSNDKYNDMADQLAKEAVGIK